MLFQLVFLLRHLPLFPQQQVQIQVLSLFQLWTQAMGMIVIQVSLQVLCLPLFQVFLALSEVFFILMFLVVFHIGQQVLHLALFDVFFPFLSRAFLQVPFQVSFHARTCLSSNSPHLSTNNFSLPLSMFLRVFPVLFFYSSPSASESGGGTAETKTTKTENRSNEDDVQAMDKSNIVGKSLAPNIFTSHKFFPRCRTSRVVNLSSVLVKWLDNMFSESLLPWFYNDHLMKKAHCTKLLKLIRVSSFYRNRDLEAITDTNDFAKVMDRQVYAGRQNVLQYVYEYEWNVNFNMHGSTSLCCLTECSTVYE